jgi:hypothetical protein
MFLRTFGRGKTPDIPGATKEASNLNKDKGNKSSVHVVCTNERSLSKSKKGRGKRRCFKCKELGHFIASCPNMNIENEMRRFFTNGKEDHVITSCPLMRNQGHASPRFLSSRQRTNNKCHVRLSDAFATNVLSKVIYVRYVKKVRFLSQ